MISKSVHDLIELLRVHCNVLVNFLRLLHQVDWRLVHLVEFYLRNSLLENLDSHVNMLPMLLLCNCLRDQHFSLSLILMQERTLCLHLVVENSIGRLFIEQIKLLLLSLQHTLDLLHLDKILILHFFPITVVNNQTVAHTLHLSHINFPQPHQLPQNDLDWCLVHTDLQRNLFYKVPQQSWVLVFELVLQKYNEFALFVLLDFPTYDLLLWVECERPLALVWVRFGPCEFHDGCVPGFYFF